jgi:hypothetical protein
MTDHGRRTPSNPQEQDPLKWLLLIVTGGLGIYAGAVSLGVAPSGWDNPQHTAQKTNAMTPYRAIANKPAEIATAMSPPPTRLAAVPPAPPMDITPSDARLAQRSSETPDTEITTSSIASRSSMPPQAAPARAAPVQAEDAIQETLAAPASTTPASSTPALTTPRTASAPIKVSPSADAELSPRFAPQPSTPTATTSAPALHSAAVAPATHITNTAPDLTTASVPEKHKSTSTASSKPYVPQKMWYK